MVGCGGGGGGSSSGSALPPGSGGATQSPTPVPTPTAVPTPTPGALSLTWTGGTSFPNSGPTVVSTTAGLAISAGVIAFAATGQIATITATQINNSTTFTSGFGTFSTLTGTCTNNITINTTSPGVFVVTDIGEAFNGCALYILGKGNFSAYYQVEGPIKLSGSGS